MKAKRRQKILKAILVKKLGKKDPERRLLRNQRIKKESVCATDSQTMRLQYQMRTKKILKGTSKTNTIRKMLLHRKRTLVQMLFRKKLNKKKHFDNKILTRPLNMKNGLKSVSKKKLQTQRRQVNANCQVSMILKFGK